jgi:hypothetical protein
VDFQSGSWETKSMLNSSPEENETPEPRVELNYKAPVYRGATPAASRSSRRLIEICLVLLVVGAAASATRIINGSRKSEQVPHDSSSLLENLAVKGSEIASPNEVAQELFSANAAGAPKSFPANESAPAEAAETVASSSMTFSHAEAAKSVDISNATLLSGKAFGVFEKRCAQCHSVKMVAEGLNVLKHNALLDPNKGYVIARNAADSMLWKRMGVDRDMPPEEADAATTEDLETIRLWIEEGAAPFPSEAPRVFLADYDVWEAVLRDLQQLPSNDRSYVRYFTLTNLHNNSFDTRLGRNNTDYAEKNIRLARAAFSKLLNSMSWAPEIVVPTPIDEAQLILRVDIRKLGWEFPRVWERIQSEYPYGLNLTVSSNEKLRHTATDIYELTRSPLPIVRADWFINTVPRGELYYEILGLPHKVSELEAMLGVNTDLDFMENRLKRAGFSESGVSRSNRLVDRHASGSDGYYWKSYDFGKSEDRGNLFKYPLGPRFAGNPYHEYAFEADGGEMIFSLPNGMQAYFLATASGERISEGPVDVVRDNKETSGTPVVVNAISCMACHQHGMIRINDTVRDSRAVPFGNVRLKVENLFPSATEMEAIIEHDRSRYLAALEKACGVFLKVGEDEDKTMLDFTEEPIGTSARFYQKDLEIEDVAVELGFDNPTALAELIRSSSKLRELGLGPLAEGAAIKRSTWASTKESLFHSLAVELEIGIAIKMR